MKWTIQYTYQIEDWGLVLILYIIHFPISIFAAFFTLQSHVEEESINLHWITRTTWIKDEKNVSILQYISMQFLQHIMLHVT